MSNINDNGCSAAFFSKAASNGIVTLSRLQRAFLLMKVAINCHKVMKSGADKTCWPKQTLKKPLKLPAIV